MSSKTTGSSFLPISDRKVLCTGQGGDDAFVFDADTHHVVTVPAVDNLKWKPISVFVPSAAAAGDDPEGILFVMERRPKHEGYSKLRPSHQFEAFAYRRSSKTSPSESWQRQLLPPPPYLRGSRYQSYRNKITSYAVLGDGSHVCISTKGINGFFQSFTATHCLDTVKHTWSAVGEWALPFEGMAEYVPELKLWFATLGTQTLGAFDLSSMDSKPSVVCDWSWSLDLDDDALEHGSAESDKTLKKWWEPLESQRVHLGSGRFIVASSFHTRGIVKTCSGTELTSNRFAVLTGVEVMAPVDGVGELQLVKHKSKRTWSV
nr:unnamed protein product [Digitaria exilis]